MFYSIYAPGSGLEPKLQGPEPCVLPLDDPGILKTKAKITFFYSATIRRSKQSQSEKFYTFKYFSTAIKLDATPIDAPLTTCINSSIQKLAINKLKMLMLAKSFTGEFKP